MKPFASHSPRAYLTGRPPFSLQEEYKVSKALTFGGFHFRIGDTFVPADIGCEMMRLRQLYDQRYLDIIQAYAPSAQEAETTSPTIKATDNSTDVPPASSSAIAYADEHGINLVDVPYGGNAITLANVKKFHLGQ